MTRRATADQLRRPRTTVVTVPVVDPDTDELVEQEFVIQRLKAGHRKRLQAEVVDSDGILDLEHANRLAVHLCTLEPAMTEDEWDDVDIDVVAALAIKITLHSGHRDISQAATSDAMEGAADAAGFHVPGGPAGVPAGVAGDRADGSDRVDA